MTALLTLALCIGANTAIFTVLHAVILAPLPFAEPERLVSMGNIYPGVGVVKNAQNSIPDYLDRRQMTDVFDSVAEYTDAGYDAGPEGSPVRLEGGRGHALLLPRASRVSHDGAPLHRRRCRVSEESIRHSELRALERHVRARPSGGGKRHTPERSELPRGGSHAGRLRPTGARGAAVDAIDLETGQATDDGRHNNNWDMVARLKPGVTIAVAQQRIDALNRHSMENAGKLRKLLENARFGTVVHGLKEQLVGDIRPTLYLLQCAVAFVLLIGCVNVANLMLVRSNIRMKELAIRYSLGAGRGTAGGATADRGHGAGIDRRSVRRSDRNGRRAPAGADRHQRIAARREHPCGRCGAGLQRGGGGTDRTGIRLRPGVSPGAARSQRGVPLHGTNRDDGEARVVDAECAGGVPGVAGVCAADRQRVVDAELRAVAGGGPGLPGAKRADRGIFTAVGALQGRRAGAQFRGRTAGARARHSWRSSGGRHRCAALHGPQQCERDGSGGLQSGDRRTTAGAALEHDRRGLPGGDEDSVARRALLPRRRYGGQSESGDCGRVPGAEILAGGQGGGRPHVSRN